MVWFRYIYTLDALLEDVIIKGSQAQRGGGFSYQRAFRYLLRSTGGLAERIESWADPNRVRMCHFPAVILSTAFAGYNTCKGIIPRFLFRMGILFCASSHFYLCRFKYRGAYDGFMACLNAIHRKFALIYLICIRYIRPRFFTHLSAFFERSMAFP